ncbi:MAG: isoleucine--tRNA ligase [Candidatus Omnitrophica bacterium]|nr:isoleucine--tRNA ligase [Candidatus Omnitrophota bacterium]
MDYKNTLNLPKTTFSMKANLPQKEPLMLKSWKEEDVYARIRRERKGKNKFILHDGPPYANGHIHMGHVLNKILKDIVVKFYTMKGFDAPFVPGWDCHGLPVEHQLLKEMGLSKHQIDQVKFRRKARDYALKFVKIQREEFERLGIFGEWNNPYLTLEPAYEAAIVRSFGHLVKNGYIYKDLKPVNWCTTCETALAEAEVEYEDHVSPSIYVKFKLKTPTTALQETRSEKEGGETYFIIWTTTPWTLLGNVAIAVHPDMDYALLEAGGEKWVMLESLAGGIMNKFKKPFGVIRKMKGRELEGAMCEHPFIKRDSRVVSASYVSSEDGTGCVHTAPGHGHEDYITGKKYALPIIMPVTPKGVFDDSCGEFTGLSIHNANAAISERLKKNGALLAEDKITHSYPHCWRCKKPIIFRATEQYFAGIDHRNLRARMLEAIKNEVKWYPAQGESRISAMVKNRPDWCLSRQRHWGVPITAFKCNRCASVLLDHDVIEHVAGIIAKNGSDAWFIKSEKELLPEGARCKKCQSSDFSKETDIVDVWFESGVSHQPVLREKKELSFPCDLYLEGSDQHRGWFQSSLITSCAIENSAPYKSVMTHGFVVDGEGRKMSKSLGNVISPEDIMKKYGADILRIWVASSNYHDDVRLSGEILERLADAYRKIRNTFRYLLGNLYDFDYAKSKVMPEAMLEVDRWMLSRTAGIIAEAEKEYTGYAFHKIFRSVYNFCVYEISSFYLDILKDRLYTFGKDSIERRSCQTVLYEILTVLLKVLAPIMTFTTEEAWKLLHPESPSIHASLWDWHDEILKGWKRADLDRKWQRILEIRGEVLKAIELKRTSGEIGSSLEAKVVLYSEKSELRAFLREAAKDLPALFITSQVEISGLDTDDSEKCENMPLSIAVRRADGSKCMRCWNYSDTVGSDKKFNDLCRRCINAIERGGK